MSTVRFDSIENAIGRIASGRAVVVADPTESWYEGDLVFAAATATAEIVAFMVRHTSGFIRTAITDADAARLRLPPMVYPHFDGPGSAHTVTVDASDGSSTGISARDRARTMRVLADPAAGPADLTRPGHLVPVRVRRGGVLTHAGRAEAALDLAGLAGLSPAAALGTIVSTMRPTEMAGPTELRAFCDRHDLPLVAVQDVVTCRRMCQVTGQVCGVAC